MANMTDSQYTTRCAPSSCSSQLFCFSIFSTSIKPIPNSLQAHQVHQLLVISNLFGHHYTNPCKTSPPNMALFSISALVSLSALWLHQPLWALKYLHLMIFFFAEHSRTGFSEKTPYGGSGFFSAPYGDYWQFIKKLCLTEFLSPEQLERPRAVREKELARFLQIVFESAKRKEVWFGC